MRITYSAATSRDGYIARDNGDVSWLEEMKIAPDETGLDEFFASVDGLVMGRGTYDFVFNYGKWPYGDKITWICTNQPIQILDGANTLVVGAVKDVVEGARDKGLQHLWLIGGGKVASSFLDEGWLTHVSISQMPVELGTGIPLFERHAIDEVASAPTIIQKKGFTQIVYEIVAEI